jgi:hypothetical protein
MDIEAWTRYVAFQALVGTADTFNQGLAHNLYLYVRPSDRRVIPMPWDVDHGFFHHPNGSLIGTGGGRFSRLIREPRNERLVYKHLLDIVETTYNLDYLQPWIHHYTQITGQDLETFFTDYVQARSQFVPQRIERLIPKTEFVITTNDGRSFETEATHVTIAGQGWVNIDELYTGDGQLLDVHWTSDTAWEIDVPIGLGENPIELTAWDMQGRAVGVASTLVTRLANRAADFDNDGAITSLDIEWLCREIGSADPRFDLDGSGAVNRSDVDDLVHRILATSYGDANLDGQFNSADLIGAFQAGGYEDSEPGNSGWQEGDWNCDGDFTSADLVLALADGGFTAAGRLSATITDLAISRMRDVPGPEKTT